MDLARNNYWHELNRHQRSCILKKKVLHRNADKRFLSRFSVCFLVSSSKIHWNIVLFVNAFLAEERLKQNF